MECYSCHHIITDDTPRSELLCRHTYHTLCLLENVIINSDFCSCGHAIISPDMYARRHAEENARATIAADATVIELKQVPTFLKDLRILKKSIRNTKIAQRGVFNICKIRQGEFVAETRPYVERIRELQLKNIAGVKKSPESKMLRLCRGRMGRALQKFETTYPKFNRINNLLLQKLKLPKAYEMRNLGKWKIWRFRRFFMTKPRLF